MQQEKNNTERQGRWKTSNDVFGGCPRCGGNDGFLNVSRHHWFVCDVHFLKWYLGSNWFAAWRDQTPETWQRNSQLLTRYAEVEPVFCAALADYYSQEAERCEHGND